MRIATWSVNSVNERLGYLCHWLEKRQPDIVALQKIRVSRKSQRKFPRAMLEKAGYWIEAHFTESQWGSVAVLLRQRFLSDGVEPVVRQRGLPGREAEGRLLTVETSRVRVSSVYVPYAPYGRATKDQVRRSIESKAKWLGRLSECVADQQDVSRPSFLCGDFNVVADGASVRECLNRSPEEREALGSLCALGFTDMYRDFHGEVLAGFNSGTPITKDPDARLHLILGSESGYSQVTSAFVDLEYRGPIEDLPGENWAAAAPLIIEIDDGTSRAKITGHSLNRTTVNRATPRNAV